MGATDSAARSPVTLTLAGLLVAMPAIVFYSLLTLQRSALPVQDDYTALLDFALRWHHAGTFSHRVTLFFTARDGDYKLYFDHACALASLAVLHRISILTLCWLGNLLWLPAVALLGWYAENSHRNVTEKLVLFAPASLLLFQMNVAETFNWAMGGLQNIGVIAFAFCAIAALLRTGRRWDIIACVLCLAAVCASANGFLLCPVALAMLLPRQWVRALVLVALFGVAFVLYRWRLQVVPKHIVTVKENAAFALNFLGGAVESIRGKPFAGAALVAGIAVAVAIALLMTLGMRDRNPFLFWITIWILLTTVLVTLGRAGGGEALARSGRYKVYSDLLLAIIYLDAAALSRRFMRLQWRRLAYVAALSAAGVMCVVADRQGFCFLQERRLSAEAQFARYLHEVDGTAALPDVQEPTQAMLSALQRHNREVLAESIRTGIYRPPAETPKK